ncbi:MAG TPA: hypothetical protein VMU65_02110 [Candidatus Saccharimonadales bacterium]|nr:hypothetical protein [Candidatus Saccharimonadales bacterium]
MEEGIGSRRPGAGLSNQEQLRKRRRNQQLRTVAIRLGVFLGAIWTIVFGVGLLVR